MQIPTRHLSVRVPWHDNGWNGKVCCSPRNNGSCMFLPRIQEKKDVEYEEEMNDKWFHELPQTKLPPCVGEKVTFMSPHEVHRLTSHPYASNKNNDKYYGHYQETSLRYPAYSFAVIPYNWMQKDSASNYSALADEYDLAYDPKKEPDLGFKNSWVQQIDNQRALLDKFIEPIKPQHSLVVYYGDVDHPISGQIDPGVS